MTAEVIMALFVLAGILFLAWLMLSSKGQQQTFLFYAWAAMLAASVLQVFFR